MVIESMEMSPDMFEDKDKAIPAVQVGIAQGCRYYEQRQS